MKQISLSRTFSLSSLLLLSNAIGYSSPSDADGARNDDSYARNAAKYPSTLPAHVPSYQQENSLQDYFLQQEMDIRRHWVNETLWAAVVEAALKTPFDWIQLSSALDSLEKDFQKRLSGTSRNSLEPDAENTGSISSRKSSRPTFTYHRVLALLRNGSRPGQRLSAIAAVSAAAIRPSPTSPPPMPNLGSLSPKSRTTSSLIKSPETAKFQRERTAAAAEAASTLQEQILSRLLEEQTENNGPGEGDYGRHSGAHRDRVPLSSSSRRHFQERWQKLSDHFGLENDDDEVRRHSGRTLLNNHHHHHHRQHPFKYLPVTQHQKRHEPIQ